MTVQEYYRQYLQQLQTIYSLDESTIIAGWVFDNKAAIKRMDILRSPEQVLAATLQAALEEALQQLLLHKPVQYVIGETWFYNLKITVNEHVLIPRPETEELVKWIIDEHASGKEKLSVLDIGTGSGCIPIALKKHLPNFDITAIDISPDALATAKQNAIINNTPVDFLQIDFLNESIWPQLPAFDIIVSNPPYIPLNEKERLDKNVTAHEPHTALFVPDHSPQLFYEKIALFAQTHLKTGGKIYVETHEDYATVTAGIFLKEYQQVEIKKDIFEKNRMVKASQFLKR
ncbi:MAG: peptide chain release factor N(5)-glutamine methyltransferase [Chitinophagaceae bacterium]|nr:peptide chain release factor N(5)-glutamine methyltransferase [Chitinophagaceae bacterium]